MQWLWKILGTSNLAVSLVRVERLAEQLLEATHAAARTCADAKQRTVPDFDPHAGDPSPDDPALRREYVARSAGFYVDVLRPKLLELMAEQSRRLWSPTSTRESDLGAKAAINAFALLMDWGDEMVSEHQADLINQDKNSSNG